MVNTLKDIENLHYPLIQHQPVTKRVFDDIRELAIKWIKELDTKDRLSFMDEDGFEYTLNCKIGNKLSDSDYGKILKIWIKHFFNISDKDLEDDIDNKKIRD